MTTATFTITDHSTGSPVPCTMYYIVEYRIAGTGGWNRVTPNPISPTVTINNLNDGLIYDLRVARVCCNGAQSDWETDTITT